MPRRSKHDRESERIAHRVCLPLFFWVIASFVHLSFSGFTKLIPDVATYVNIATGFFVVVGICFIPFSIKTVRDELF